MPDKTSTKVRGYRMLTNRSDARQHTNTVFLLSEFVLRIGRHHIRWNANFESNYVKSLMLAMVRKKVPNHIKIAIFDAIKRRVITPEIHESYDDIKNAVIRVKFPGSEDIIKMSFAEFYKRYLYNLPKKSVNRSDGSRLTSKEEAEKFARNASRMRVGNCNECRDVCELIWSEITPEFISAFDLPAIQSTCLEQVHYNSGADHCFNIANRHPDSDIQDITSWIRDGQEVVIIDLWKNPSAAISVNEQLKLPPRKRNFAFESLRENLSHGATLEVVSTRRLGEGHSTRWLDRKKDEYYFTRKKFPHDNFFSQRQHQSHLAHQQTEYPKTHSSGNSFSHHIFHRQREGRRHRQHPYHSTGQYRV